MLGRFAKEDNYQRKDLSVRWNSLAGCRKSKTSRNFVYQTAIKLDNQRVNITMANLSHNIWLLTYRAALTLSPVRNYVLNVINIRTWNSPPGRLWNCEDLLSVRSAYLRKREFKAGESGPISLQYTYTALNGDISQSGKEKRRARFPREREQLTVVNTITRASVVA